KPKQQNKSKMDLQKKKTLKPEATKLKQPTKRKESEVISEPNLERKKRKFELI
ncbi:hypothetical protein C1646_685541, partial [Rhizophagus diaphanus]